MLKPRLGTAGDRRAGPPGPAEREPDVASAQQKKPNILVIWGDDVGWFNISAYNHGMMGYKTPNIDRLAQGRRNVHRLVWPAELHGRTRSLPYRAIADPHRSS